MTEPTGPLDGIRILDLTNILFGPFAVQTLGDWGADVIKVEATTGDGWRYSGQFRNRGMSGQFMAANRNKRSLALDLKHAEGKAVLRRLIPTVDALVTNVRPAALARLGFSYEACQELNPRLIYAAATGFGQDGPWAARPAFDEIVQAASGFASAIGTDEEPAFVPSLVADKLCGLMLTAAVNAALLRRERSGRGQLVEVPMLETLAAFNSIEMLGGHAFVPPVGPAGYKRLKERRPMRTKDGWLTMLPYSGENWSAFFEAVGRPELINELEVKDPVLRARNIDKIYDRMSEIALGRTTAEWEELLLAIDVPHAAFAKLTEIAEQPHLKAVGMFVELDHPSEGRIRQARPSTRFSEGAIGVRRMPPRLGEHSKEVLRELGYSDAEVASLIESKAVGVLS
ncbi:CoA transferase [Bradyrhizobium sp. LHD-71]|uniref:CaiB/BaiF CoA transferase family protein n=1 Tax=Bradyrhizobium sp. LHD-71 TaxID=3072141 RepID=UPI00280CC94D|nr:CoA transferase [Bradyrhizobium sp. LHD-71]MDQ8728166.1 CoA transferase [Bradyrhizobium sp. LHD-71]